MPFAIRLLPGNVLTIRNFPNPDFVDVVLDNSQIKAIEDIFAITVGGSSTILKDAKLKQYSDGRTKLTLISNIKHTRNKRGDLVSVRFDICPLLPNKISALVYIGGRLTKIDKGFSCKHGVKRKKVLLFDIKNDTRYQWELLIEFFSSDRSLIDSENFSGQPQPGQSRTIRIPEGTKRIVIEIFRSGIFEDYGYNHFFSLNKILDKTVFFSEIRRPLL